MGRPKGGNNRYWSKEDKYKLVKRIIEDNYSVRQIAREENIDHGMLSKWVRVYLQNGMLALENKKKPGNPLTKYARKKELSETEKLEYEILKLRIENERLKKGYMMKGDGTFVMYKR